MKKSILTAAILAASASVAFAQAPSPKDDSSLSTKAMEDQPGTTGGGTDMPKAKPGDSSLSTKAIKDQPGTRRLTISPSLRNFEPMSGSLAQVAPAAGPGG